MGGWRIDGARGDIRTRRERQQFAQIDRPEERVVQLLRLQKVATAANLRERSRAELRQAATHVARDEREERGALLAGCGELLAQRFVLGGDTDRTGVLVALARVDAAERDQ